MCVCVCVYVCPYHSSGQHVRMARQPINEKRQTHLGFGWHLCDGCHMRGNGEDVELVINDHTLGTGGQREDEPVRGQKIKPKRMTWTKLSIIKIFA